jgi:hypothetical protein
MSLNLTPEHSLNMSDALVPEENWVSAGKVHVLLSDAFIQPTADTRAPWQPGNRFATLMAPVPWE